MNFWLRNIILAVILITLAYFLFVNQELLFSFNEQTPEQQTSEVTADVTKKTIEKKAKTKPKANKPRSTNAAAEGLSKFYASINPDMNSKGPRIKNNVVFLPDVEPAIKLIELLEARRHTTRPYRKNWQGTTDNRPFRKGQTLYQKLNEYAVNDGLELIWWLNRDLIVKSPFRIDQNILDTARQIGRSIEGHFINGVATYFCYRHRAIVLIEEPIEYLTEECILLKSKRKY